jgi:hypothetical protein
MKLILATLVFSAGLGLIVGGRVSALASLKVRWTPAALIGLALQLVPWPGATLPLLMVFVSYGILLAFALANVRAGLPGFGLVLIGIVMNFTVIAVNQGMPVTRDALIASHQEETLPILLDRPGAKHHLAGPDDRLMFLADVIPVPPLDLVVSLGDVLAYAGVAWLIIGGMRRHRRAVPDANLAPEGVS